MTRSRFHLIQMERKRPSRAIRERGAEVFVIEDVPALACGQCGEEYYEGWVLEEMDRLMADSSRSRREIRVPVMQFERQLVA